ncbi:hypothetical protein AAAA28_21445 [Providencia stuartii]|uniref:Uncharacterized protein n=1 Tax=Providencia stuartii ATCC 25827 TaxID=471874 RepID=A0AA87CTD1_PROST|nr:MULTISPECIES: hypothetical protein [Providencia]EDU61190.1 hypothetical protein PROSTU_00832 [Providencia stuartii ATCC 25827]EDU61862.1 hypothetical protein PROSTU_00119 [Providencia stuartii ATCC 25827]MBS7785543.1 hypothetical protein [Providencia thailandensis]MCR4082004.1 hypothetical protein [Providencia stuartii]
MPTELPLENATADFSAEQRFFIVIETATMSERELAEYCRSKGVFVDDVKAWRALSSIYAETELIPTESQSVIFDEITSTTIRHSI